MGISLAWLDTKAKAIPCDVPFMVPNDTEIQDPNTDGKISEAVEPSHHLRKCPENSMSDGSTEDNISLQEDLKVTSSITEDNISIQEDLKVTSSITTNVEASMEDTVQDEPTHMKPRISKRQKKPPTTKSDNFLW
jgi:hypothetical protein